VDISSTCKVGQKLRESLPLLTCSPSAWPSRLLYRKDRKSRGDLWITLYITYNKYINKHVVNDSICDSATCLTGIKLCSVLYEDVCGKYGYTTLILNFGTGRKCSVLRSDRFTSGKETQYPLIGRPLW